MPADGVFQRKFRPGGKNGIEALLWSATKNVSDTYQGVVMRVHNIALTAIALCISACGKQESTEPEPAADDPAAAPAEEVAEERRRFDQAFIDHMHEHAEQLDELMFALADDDLEGAMTPAFWLSRHETVSGVPEEWQQYVTGMRQAAAAVESADDLETAKTAAERISEQCQACHDVAGINALDGS